MSYKDGGPAFPGPCQHEQRVDINEGLSLREYFAAAALYTLHAGDFANYRDMAFDAYQIADAMLEARKELR